MTYYFCSNLLINNGSCVNTYYIKIQPKVELFLVNLISLKIHAFWHKILCCTNENDACINFRGEKKKQQTKQIKTQKTPPPFFLNTQKVSLQLQPHH